MLGNIKEKILGTSGGISAGASVLGSWQVCHSICLGVISILSIIGITVAGMPLAFLTEFALPLWSVAFLLLFVTIAFYITKKCISRNLILFNAGLIIAGVPFREIQQFQSFFWFVGGILVLTAVSFFIKNKIKKQR